MTILSVMVLSACSSSPTPTTTHAKSTARPTAAKIPAQPKSRDGVQDISWTLLTIKNRQAKFFNQVPSLRLNSSNSRLSGNTGCNVIYGQYQISTAQQSIHLSARAGHQACDGALAQEADLFDALQDVTAFQVQGNMIRFLDKSGKVLMTGKQK